MGVSYISVDRLRQFIENIATAPTMKRSAVDYVLAVKDGCLYRVGDSAAPYLLVAPEAVQWIGDTAVIYSVSSNTRWYVE